MDVNPVPTMGWTRKSAAATILFVTEEQRRGIAARMAARMETKGLTNEKLAQEAGVSVKTISRLLNGRNEPRTNTLAKVAPALGLSEDELRGPAPAPLGLGAKTQLDRVEETLNELVERLVAAGVLAAVEKDNATGTPPAPAKRRKRAA